MGADRRVEVVKEVKEVRCIVEIVLGGGVIDGGWLVGIVGWGRQVGRGGMIG